MKKRLLSLVLAVVLCVSLLPTAALAEGETHTNHCVCGATHTVIGDHETENLLTWTAWTQTSTLPDTTGYYYLTDDVVLTASHVISGNDKNIVLCLNGHKISSATDGVDLIKVTGGTGVIGGTYTDGATLTITDCKETGQLTHDNVSDSSPATKATGRGLYIQGGIVNIFGGKITGNRLNGADADTCNGAGILMTGGDFHNVLKLYGGQICDNQILQINTECKNTPHGAGVYAVGNTDSLFTMYGGQINNNRIESSTSSIMGCGVHTQCGVSMHGGEISSNSAKITYTTTTGSPYVAGVGVYSFDVDFTMTGGTISGNQAETSGSQTVWGGGVYNYKGKFQMSGTAKIQNNQAATGGGVYNNNGTVTMSGGSIDSNKASYGGGVYNNNGTVSMSGGSIQSNTADSFGGGVYNYGTMSMSDGSIGSNTADSFGGGVFHTGISFSVDGSAAVTGNTVGTASNKTTGNVHLAYNSYHSTSGNTQKTLTVGENFTGSVGLTIYKDNSYNPLGQPIVTGPTTGIPAGITMDQPQYQLSADGKAEDNAAFSTEVKYEWYTGVSGNEYEIKTVGELSAFRNIVNGTAENISADSFAGKTVKLGADLNLSSIANWTPIGKSGSGFEGTFRGQNKKITGLKVATDAIVTAYGLFGCLTNNAQVYDLSVSGTVTGDDSVGGIVGYLKGGTGEGDEAKLVNCSFSGTVNGGTGCTGGIAGKVEHATLEKCYNTAAVSATGGQIGGIVGYTAYSIEIRNCYNQGNVSAGFAAQSVGGLVGKIDMDSGSRTIRCCYNVGGLVCEDGSQTQVGGLIGQLENQNNNGSISVTYSYYLNNTTRSIGITNGYSTNTISAEAKSADDFASGEIAWTLQNACGVRSTPIWGQKLTGANKDDYPVFYNNNRVINVLFLDTAGEPFAPSVDGVADRFINLGDTIQSLPTLSNADFNGWRTGANNTGETFTTNTPVTIDMCDSQTNCFALYAGTKSALTGVSVSMNGYTFGDTPSTPSILGEPNGAAVTYYYNTTNSTTGGTEWKDINGTTLNAGTYYLYATVAATDDYTALTTDAVQFVIAKATPSVAAPTPISGLQFTGSAQGLIHAGSTTGGTMQYRLGGSDTWTTSASEITGIAAQTYTVYWKVEGSTNYNGNAGGSITASIGTTALPSERYSAPTAITGLTYNTTSQTLVVPGSVSETGYTMQYQAVEKSGDSFPAAADDGWSTSVPTRKNAGDYRVYWRITGNGSYSGTSGSVDVSIQKATQESLTITSAMSMVYRSFLQLTSEGGSGTGEVTYTVQDGSGAATLRSGSSLFATKVGTVTVQATKAGGTNYQDVTSQPVTITIEKATLSGEPSYDLITESGKMLKDANLRRNTAWPGVNSSLGWVDENGQSLSDFTIVEPNKSYTWRLSVDESDQGNVDPTFLSGSVVLYTPVTTGGDIFPLLPILNALNQVPFDDVKPGDWFYDDVRYVNEYGLMTGTSSNQFSPNAPVTRAMVMTILARREGIRTDRYSPWYAAGVEWAVANGISDGTNPEAAITREQLAVMLYRYAQLRGYNTGIFADLAFSDANGVSSYAVSGLRWAVGYGLMSGAAGVHAGKLLPQNTATRAQLAAMLHRFFG